MYNVYNTHPQFYVFILAKKSAYYTRVNTVLYSLLIRNRVTVTLFLTTKE